MNIHLPAILGFTRYQGFDPSPHEHRLRSMSDVSYGAAINARARMRAWQQGLGLLEVWQQGLQVNTILYNASISACSTPGGWQQGMGIVRRMKHGLLEADVVSFSAVMNCERIGKWQNGMLILDRMRELQIQSNAISYSTASTCAKGHQWQQSLIAEMQMRQIETNTIMCNSALMVFGQTAWRCALEAFCNFQTIGLQVNPRTCGIAAATAEQSSQWQSALALSTQALHNVQVLTTAISACEQGDQWEQAISLLSQFQRVSKVDIVAYNATISACAKSGKWQMSLHLLEQMTGMSLKEDDVTFNVVMNALAQGSQWRRSLALLEDLKRSGRTDIVTFSSAIAACDKSSQWRAGMLLLDQIGDQRPRRNEVIYNTAIHSCQLGQQWFIALELLHSMSEGMILPSIVSWDSAMLACLGCRDDLAFEVLLESECLRDPISFLWALASLSVSDAEVIYDAGRNVIEKLWCSGGSAKDLARCWWAAATLGIRSEQLSSMATTSSRSNRISFKSAMLDDLSMALTGLAGMSWELSFMLDAQTSVGEMLTRAHPDQLLFPREGKDLLAILFSCTMAGCLSSRLRRVSRTVMRDVGSLLDTRSGNLNPGLDGHDLVVSSMGDRYVILKPPDWEVYGGHVKKQLINFVKQSMSSPILMDAQHNFGFLHRLDVPSSGLILVAKNYKAFYDLQVQLHSGEISREYSVLSHGNLPASLKEVRARTRIQHDLPTLSGGRGKLSKTTLMLSRYMHCAVGMLSLLLIKILTGRKHQIRSHLAHVGHPTLRDKMYTSRAIFQSDAILSLRNWLHRHRITFTDAGRTPCEACCDLPADLSAVFRLAIWTRYVSARPP